MLLLEAIRFLMPDQKRPPLNRSFKLFLLLDDFVGAESVGPSASFSALAELCRDNSDSVRGKTTSESLSFFSIFNSDNATDVTGDMGGVLSMTMRGAGISPSSSTSGSSFGTLGGGSGFPSFSGELGLSRLSLSGLPSRGSLRNDTFAIFLRGEALPRNELLGDTEDVPSETKLGDAEISDVSEGDFCRAGVAGANNFCFSRSSSFLASLHREKGEQVWTP